MSKPTYILLGIGGSHAHGLAHENSDYDFRGVFSYPTEEFFHLDKPSDSLVTSDPDSTSHELEKFLRLASKGNPDVLDVLGLNTYADFEYEWGPRLVELTPALLGAKPVRSAFIGYATGQFKELEKRHAEGNDSFSAGMGSRTWKHAKHLFRLLEGAERILTTGRIDTRVSNRDWYLNVLPELSIEQMIALFHRRRSEVELVESNIPDLPDLDKVNQYLSDYRKAH